MIITYVEIDAQIADGERVPVARRALRDPLYTATITALLNLRYTALRLRKEIG